MKKWKKVACFMLTMCVLAAAVFVGGDSIAEAKTGKWKHSKEGYWYSYSDGGYAKNEWLKVSGKWYHFNSKGYMQTGWKKISGKWYYFGTNGSMRTNWKKVSGKWYYFGTDGSMRTNWKKVSGKWYYFGTDGSMRTNWKKISGKWYYFGTDGSMKTGWKKISGKWYYFNGDGIMQTGTKTINGKKYTFDSNGVWKEDGTGSKTAAKMKAPSTKGWTSKDKIYAYSWDDDFEKKLNVVLDAYPQYKPYVEYVNLGVASEESIDLVNAAFNSKEYPSLIPTDIGSTKYFSEDDSKTLDLYSIGFTKEMLENSYQYAIEYGTYNGKLKAVTWQSCAGSVFYNKKIAKKVWGTDDPKVIQSKISNWDNFFKAANELKAKGYKIVNGAKDVYYAIINAHTTPWVKKASDGKKYYEEDSSIKQYLETAKKLTDGGYTNNGGMWDSGWSDNMQSGGNVFCYFGCPWMTGVFSGNGAKDGEWATCVGPSSYYWGGTYVSVGKKTNNPELCAFILYELTCDPDIAVKITNETGDVVNNIEANRRLANGELKSDNRALQFFGGQNPYKVWADAAVNVTQKAVTYWDKYYEAPISDAAESYASGESTFENALGIIDKYSKKELDIPAK